MYDHSWLRDNKKTKKMIPVKIILILLVTIVQVKGPIIKPYGEWLCNYCAMGKSLENPFN